MINQNQYNDLAIIDPEGNIVYHDREIYKAFGIDVPSVTGKNLSVLYRSPLESHPAVLAARQGVASEHFEISLVTARGASVTKAGCAYPICCDGKPIAALEFSTTLYEKTSDGKPLPGALSGEGRPSSQGTDGGSFIYRANNTKYITDDIITADPEMIHLKEQIERLAITDHTVLIYGQTGTGKELIAQALHNSSRRYTKKFIAVNCGAIPDSLMESLLFGSTRGSFTGAEDRPGFFEQADGGTIFLDEINSVDPMLQTKLMKTIESKTVRRIGSVSDKKVDVRIIAAVNEEPRALMRKGKILPDLFYRLSVVYLRLPTLARRGGDDILLLADHFRRSFNARLNMNVSPFGDEIKQLFLRYDWPGNVRELKNVIEGAFVFAETDDITVNEMPRYLVERENSGRKDRLRSDASVIDGGLTLKERKELLEKAIVEEAYALNGENLAAAARQLRISEQLLHYKLLKYRGEANEDT